MAAIVRAAAAERWAGRFDARVVAVLSNKSGAGGLAFARSQGLATAVVPHAEFDSREAFDTALAEAIDVHAPALVVLAGFMRILTPGFVARYEGRLLNIHPSLLPAFPGLHTHRRAIEAGCRVAGVPFIRSPPNWITDRSSIRPSFRCSRGTRRRRCRRVC